MLTRSLLVALAALAVAGSQVSASPAPLRFDTDSDAYKQYQLEQAQIQGLKTPVRRMIVLPGADGRGRAEGGPLDALVLRRSIPAEETLEELGLSQQRRMVVDPTSDIHSPSVRPSKPYKDGMMYIMARSDGDEADADLQRRIVLLPGMHPIKTAPGTHILRREQAHEERADPARLDPTRGGTFFGP